MGEICSVKENYILVMTTSKQVVLHFPSEGSVCVFMYRVHSCTFGN
jgi:hypothetical protein